MLSPALSDTDDDDDEHSVSSPPLRSTANTTPSTYTAPKDGILRLPTRWNEHARHPSLTVSSDGRDLTYSGVFLFPSDFDFISCQLTVVIGTSLTDVEAVSARANHPIPPACGVFYYEIEILRSKGGAGAGAKAQISLGYVDRSIFLGVWCSFVHLGSLTLLLEFALYQVGIKTLGDTMEMMV